MLLTRFPGRFRRLWVKDRESKGRDFVIKQSSVRAVGVQLKVAVSVIAAFMVIVAGFLVPV
jgi:NADH:ubiquinone oxidoreductase subunit 4 (subunit M)